MASSVDFSELPSWLQSSFARLDDSQKAAACADPNRSLLIQAGAGSGKTQTMASRIAFLIDSGVMPANILGICFTRKAAQELRTRVETTLRGSPHALEAKKLKLRTLHAFGLECLRRFDRIDETTDVYDQQRQSKLAKEVVMAHARMTRDADAAERLVDYVNIVKTRKSLPPVETDPSRQEAYLFPFYQRTLHDEQNAVDFGDLQQMFYALLKPQKSPPAGTDAAPRHEKDDGAVVDSDTMLPPHSTTRTFPSPACLALRYRFTHIIVDEFQDLNEVQFEIIALLAGDACRVTCVGDPNQCIYGWRGALADIFTLWKRRFRITEERVLCINYRSDPTIVSAANSLVRAAQAPFHRRRNLEVSLVKCEDECDEFEAVSFTIEHVLRVRDARLRYGEIAVLCRTRARAAQILDSLRDHNIPAVELRSQDSDGGVSAIASLLAYFRLCVNPHRDDDVHEVLTTAPHRLSPRVTRSFMMSLYATRDSLRRSDAWGGDGDGRERERGFDVGDHVDAAQRYSLYNVLKHLVHHGFAEETFPLMGKVTKPTIVIVREFIAVLESVHQLLSEFHRRWQARSGPPTVSDMADVVASCLDTVVVKAHYDSGAGAVDFVQDDSAHGANGARKRGRGQSTTTTTHGRRHGKSGETKETGAALADDVARSFTNKTEAAAGNAADAPPARVSLRALLHSVLDTIRADAEEPEPADVLAPPPQETVAVVVKTEGQPSATAAVTHERYVVDVDEDSDSDVEVTPAEPKAPPPATADAAEVRHRPPRPPPPARPEQLLLYVLDEFITSLPSDDFGNLQCQSLESGAGGGKAAHGEQEGVRAMAAVAVGTVHSAKGLEWPAVILPGCNEGHFPLNNDPEERRVFYVAMSRAQIQLVLLTSEKKDVLVNRLNTNVKTTTHLLCSSFISELIALRGQRAGTYQDVLSASTSSQKAPSHDEANKHVEGVDPHAAPSPTPQEQVGGLHVFTYEELQKGYHKHQLEM